MNGYSWRHICCMRWYLTHYYQAWQIKGVQSKSRQCNEYALPYDQLFYLGSLHICKWPYGCKMKMKMIRWFVLVICISSSTSLAFMFKSSTCSYGLSGVKGDLSHYSQHIQGKDVSNGLSLVTGRVSFIKRRHKSNLLNSRNSIFSLQDANIDRESLFRSCFIMFLISAPLGTLLDNYHGLFDVLNYHSSALPGGAGVR